ncbi:Class 3 adenylate cyclase [Plantibacter sp. RU18]
MVYTRGTTVNDAMTSFTAGFQALQQATLPAKAEASLDAFYRDTFLPELAARTNTAPDSGAYIPSSAAERYLQATYTNASLDFDAAVAVDDAGDGSEWSASNALYQDYFREMVTRFGYDDALLISASGDVVYSAYKGIDLGSNVLSGPLSGGYLGAGFTAALHSNAVDYAALSDFESYAPSLGSPVQWVFSPVGQDGQITGVMALQLPTSQINSIMTGDEEWVKDGLGVSGEVYLAGSDHLLRSNSRLLIEDPAEYRRRAIDSGTPPETAQRSVAVGSSILLQPSNTASVAAALAGKTGTLIGPGYLGGENLAAYTPVELDGLQWVLVARIDATEAFAPVTDFTRTLLLSLLGIGVAISLLSLVLAQVFARPVRALVQAVRRVAGGDYGAEVPDVRRDEFGDLGTAFNDMNRSLRLKQDLIEQQRTENEKLLLTLMPASVAKRYKEGEETISEVHQDVSVIFADMIGFDDFSRQLTAEQGLALLNGIVRSFDDAAERLGIEQVRALREGYLASCGLIVPRVDNIRRTLDFAIEMQATVTRFNAQHRSNLSLRIGVDAGTVTSGLVGRTSLAYDMWGDAVSLANQVQTLSGQPGIFVSQHVRDRMQDTVAFEPAGTVDTRDGQQPVWKVGSVPR